MKKIKIKRKPKKKIKLRRKYRGKGVLV